MAKSCATLVAAMAVFALVGCQAEQPPAMVKNLPPPNFNGPSDLSAPPPPPAVAPPVAPQLPSPPVAVQPRVPAPRAPIAGIPPEWTPPIRANTWRYIIIHHSATPNGGAVMFDRIHKAKGWDELGYHFVIGNGTDTRDGQIEVGPRWRKQKWGAHAKTPDNKYNDYGIGICLVGNFDITRPTPKQLESAAKLVAFLERTYNIPPERVFGHGMVHTFDKGGTSTDCPGRNMNVAQIRQMSARVIAESGGTVPAEATATASGGELLYSATARVTH
jgi:hypothetical protein